MQQASLRAFLTLLTALIVFACDSREEISDGSSYASSDLKALGFYAVIDGHLSPLFEQSKSIKPPDSYRVPSLISGRDYLLLYGPVPATFMNIGFWIQSYDKEAGGWSTREMSVDGLMSREPDTPVNGQPVTKYVPRTTMQQNTYILKRYITDTTIGSVFSLFIHQRSPLNSIGSWANI